METTSPPGALDRSHAVEKDREIVVQFPIRESLRWVVQRGARGGS